MSPLSGFNRLDFITLARNPFAVVSRIDDLTFSEEVLVRWEHAEPINPISKVL